MEKALQWGNVKQKPFKANAISLINRVNKKTHGSSHWDMYLDIDVL